ncbi:MAG: ribonuclease D, partial [Gemmatimonadetes bacterium]|nr:ribonuclease D [Gemmatimonadota bacterium]NIQ53533.1 ribonuclease D [Gemmatimonadota bacterium]NIU73681.1 ribonuclease D [Gammaproteobacteria bacterium]NIX43851.1 ribonuclease D [Gemmatimonadota bacterium]NIY08053.1 ribonuclease D [Gemmatimonadota bacterium]
MRLIETIPDLEHLADRLAGEPLIAADTEAAGYHRYLDRLCLVQLSTRDETWLVDTLALGSLNPIAELFADPAIEILFHDADFDLRLLDRDFGVYVRGLFDTKIAARFVGERSFGLASMLEDELGLELEKKYQRADWAKRPLPREMLEYAAMDTRYLPELRDRLRDRLIELGRLAWAEEEFRLQEQTEWEPPEDEATAYLRLKRTRDLGPRSLAALREIYRWREETARRKDVASFRVLNNDTLVSVAREMPRSSRELEDVARLSRGNARRWGDALLEGVERARALPEAELPRRPRPPRRRERDPQLERRVAQLKTVRDEAAEGLDLDRGFLMPRSQLEAVARAMPSDTDALAGVDGVRRWQVEALGDGLLSALSG